MSKPLALPPAMSTEARDAGIRSALLDGTFAAIAASCALFVGHRALPRIWAQYSTIPSAPLRVFSAVVVTGAFAYTSGLSQANHSTRANIEYSAALRERDLRLRAEREGGGRRVNV
jgi:hypothetical protein